MSTQIIISFNPVDESHWIKKKYFDHVPPDTKFIHSNYLDNPYLPQPYIDTILDYKNTDFNRYRVMALGEWGRIVPDSGRFYKDFDTNTNTILLEKSKHYSINDTLHLSFDFNVNPYMTCTVWQGNDGNMIQIDEILSKSPNNTSPAIAKAIAKKYRNHNGKVYVYGDPNGKTRDTRDERRRNDYDYILENLKEFSVTLKVRKKAPSITDRGNFINALFRGDIEGCSISIGVDCKDTVTDYVHLLEDRDGKKHKQKDKDSNGVTFEKYGHTSDANDYFICEYYRNEMTKYIKGSNKRVFISGN